MAWNRPEHQEGLNMSYDPKCEELARHFLPSGASPKIIWAVAQRIQDAVEDEIESQRLKVLHSVYWPGSQIITERKDCYLAIWYWECWPEGASLLRFRIDFCPFCGEKIELEEEHG
jgi:hypothetical protein